MVETFPSVSFIPFDVIKTVSPTSNYHEFDKSESFFEGETVWKHFTLA